MIGFMTKTNRSNLLARLVKRQMDIVKIVTAFAKYSIVGYCVGETFVNVVGWPASINGKSMQPTLLACQAEYSDSWCWRQFMSEWVWVNNWRAQHHNINRGDIIVYISPKNPNEMLIKRVIALEGDIVDLDSDSCYPLTRLRIPSGHVWVHGDNRSISVDSNK